MKNPFTLKVVTEADHFCNRVKEIDQLVRHAKNATNVVLYSPRRYGKTSLVRQVQSRLKSEKFITVFIDLFGLSSVDNIADRIAKGLYSGIYPHKPLMGKAADIIKTYRPNTSLTGDTSFGLSVEKSSQRLFGEDLLDETLTGVGHFLENTKRQVNIVLDEFQEIVELKNSNIEGILRSHIQTHPAAYFFVGSRRRVLLEMFNLKRRPFFQSALEFKLDVLPQDELVTFIVERFAVGKKTCEIPRAAEIAAITCNHPFYTQKLCYLIFEEAKSRVLKADIQRVFQGLIEGETFYFEKCVQLLAPQQIAVLKAIAKEPTRSVLSAHYMQTHSLKSVGGVQGALKKLRSLDYIEQGKDSVWKVVDPIFSLWLENR
ncbi:ATP-binding protein [uncultured Desulfosarcina sp.]|uniref:AAA family ATPase n=1 Tax=uncultured Desulfosarcina sp. TaxID=218289 RepID=UPI0029C8EEEA|nr:ATP-binding protein [uncultured Desulfosarcina sp.]